MDEGHQLVNVVVTDAQNVSPANQRVRRLASTCFEQPHTTRGPVGAEPNIFGHKFKPVLHEIRRAQVRALGARQDLRHANTTERLNASGITRIIGGASPLNGVLKRE